MKAGLPDFVAAILSNSDASAAAGWLFDDSRTLEKTHRRADDAAGEHCQASGQRHGLIDVTG